ncbi:MAG: hypothetical protein ACRDRS_12515 [Pseudonocardiaceae bacterium]
MPCTLLCQHAATTQRNIRACLRPDSSAPDLDWFDELDHTPVEWSSLHGIAEIKTPVFKLTQPTTGYAEKLLVRIPGSTQPAGAAKGLRFPYEGARNKLGEVRRRARTGRSRCE